MSKPFAVCISDIHYNLSTLELADASLRQALKKSEQLRVPLIIAGDLHDTKANMRAECLNRLMTTLIKGIVEEDSCKLFQPERVYILRGNHDSINEKSQENALSCLSTIEGVSVINKAGFINKMSFNGNSVWFVAYHHDLDELRIQLKKIDDNSLVFMHQGLTSALPGEYSHDKTAIPKEWVEDFRVISGHYHARQDIKTGRPRRGAVGLFSYIGNPFTTNYAEAKDPEKGFQILMDDGTLEFVPTNLRKHVILEMTAKEAVNAVIPVGIRADDLVWCKVSGTKEQLSKVNKQKLETMLNNKNIRLELIPTDEVIKVTVDPQDTTTLINILIDAQDLTSNQKQDIKQLWSKLQE